MDCSNQYTIALIEEEANYGEEHVIQTKEDIIYIGQDELLVSKNLSIQLVEDDPYWLRHIIVHIQCTSHGMVCDIIIDEESFEDVVSTRMVEKLKLLVENHLSIVNSFG